MVTLYHGTDIESAKVICEGSVADKLNESGLMLDSVEKILNTAYPWQIVFHTLESLRYIKKLSYRSI